MTFPPASKESVTENIFLLPTDQRIDKPSEPFEVIGKIIPRYENENWTFTELLYEAPYLKSYQDEEDEEDEEADCLEYIDNTDKIIYLYY